MRRDAAGAVPYSIAPGRSIRHSHTRRQSASDTHVERVTTDSDGHAHSKCTLAGRHLCIVAAHTDLDTPHHHGAANVHTGAHAGAICHTVDRGQHTHTTAWHPNGDAPTRAAIARRQPPAAGNSPAHANARAHHLAYPRHRLGK